MPTITVPREVLGPCLRRLEGPLDLLRLHELNPQRYPHLLQSTTPGPQARYDILFAYPEQSLVLDGAGRLEGAVGNDGGFLAALDELWRSAGIPRGSANDRALPFRGGWFLYLGYELAGQIEPRLRLPRRHDGLPDAIATRFRSAFVRDHSDGSLWATTEPGTEVRLDEMARDARVASACVADAPEPPNVEISEDPPGRYLEMLGRTLRYIREGDVFQANLARTWRARFTGSVTPAQLFRRLRIHNPGPFNGLATWDRDAVISSSPERLVRVCGSLVETRPIAGTRPRGERAEADGALSRELLGHPKERAEHVMLIDLERNDLGRVCEPGSIRVDELMVLESYAHVHHIVSNVRGRLRSDITPGQVIRALFPGGTITGCPKVRCMEIIAELEGIPRGAYTGSMGYLNCDGDLDLNILIRTLEQRDELIELRAGAGIVADSDPERELAETRAKARGLLLALGGRSE